MNCDPIARVYRWLEYGAFGRELERRRFRFLPEVAGARRALVLGDGDGRFLARFTAESNASVDYIDRSARMLDLARRRAGGERVSYQRGDALAVRWPSAPYDLFATHFFLDCFEQSDLEKLARRVRESTSPGARWLISEFRQPRWASPILAALYLFFGITTGLKTKRLVDHHPILQRHGFILVRHETSRAGLLSSELWTLDSPEGVAPSPSGHV